MLISLIQKSGWLSVSVFLLMVLSQLDVTLVVYSEFNILIFITEHLKSINLLSSTDDIPGWK